MKTEDVIKQLKTGNHVNRKDLLNAKLDLERLHNDIIQRLKIEMGE